MAIEGLEGSLGESASGGLWKQAGAICGLSVALFRREV